MLYKATIGLEIHAELCTSQKLFCACPVSASAPANTACCPVCLGYPGAMPVLNREAVEKALLLGAALCWFCAEGALSRRAALGEGGTAAAALPALRTVMAAAVAYTAVYRFCTLFAMEPWLQGMNPSLYYTVSRLVQFWM